jgi:hypothetical protein
MNQKLKKIASNLADTIEDFERPQSVYDSLLSLVKIHIDYFSVLGPESIIKLTFLIYSLKKTNNFELGEKMINDSMFLFTLFSEGNEHRDLCEVCVGDGQVECNTCDGTGETPCEECDVTGEVTCDTCDGSGVDPDNEEESCWDCNGGGNLTCPSCHGNTVETCPECHGTRLEPCQNCDEIGEVVTDDWDYEMETILTWDKSLISKAIEFENTLVPIIPIEEYNQHNNYIVIQYYGDDNYLDFKKGFRSEEVYCFGYNDNPDVKLTPHGMVVGAPFKNLSNFGS